jgi:uncharacterized protein
VKNLYKELLMRRNEFEVHDPKTIQEVLDGCDYGILSILSNNEPYGVAVNFVYNDGAIYFHGSREGRKAEAIGTKTKSSFLVVQPYAYLPSYFSDTRSACPATHYFASVHVSGTVTLIEASAHKAKALNALMQKHQSEGGYEIISPENPIYTKMLEKTGVYHIAIDQMSLKVKAGQNLSQEQRERLIDKLHERNGAGDSATIQAIKEHTPCTTK